MLPAKTRILIVDDFLPTRQLLMLELEGRGFKHVHSAEDGRSALAWLVAQDEKGEAIELVISDWNMPILSGIELLKKVRTTPAFSKLPFLLVTEEGDFAKVHDAVAHGVSGYITKPFKMDVVVDKINLAWFRSRE